MLTYDDWLEGHGGIVINELIAKNMVGTMYVVTNNSWRSGGYITMQNAVNHGIEIGNHTVSHQNLTSISFNNAKNEITNAYNLISSNVTNQKCITFAYPYGAVNPNVIDYVAKTNIAARGVNGRWYWNNQWRYDFTNPSKISNAVYKPYYEITTYSVSNATSILNISTELDNAVSNGGLITFLFHEIYNTSIGNASGFNAVTESYHAQILNHLQTYSNVWNATLSDAIKYHKERNSATLSTISESNTLLTLNLTDTLYNNSIYNHPLTIDLKLSSSIDSIVQNGKKINNYSFNNDTLTFNAIPDGGYIEIYKATTTSIASNQNSSFVKEIYPNPAKNNITLMLHFQDETEVKMTVFNELGQDIHHHSGTFKGVGAINIDCSTFSAGLYTIYLNGGKYHATHKFLKVE